MYLTDICFTVFNVSKICCLTFGLFTFKTHYCIASHLWHVAIFCITMTLKIEMNIVSIHSSPLLTKLELFSLI